MPMKIIMSYLLILFLFVNLMTTSKAQTANNDYQSWLIMTTPNENPTEGVMNSTSDSSLTFHYQNKKQAESISITRIDEMQFRKKNAVGYGIAYGAIPGFFLGFLIGYLQGDDPSPSFKNSNALGATIQIVASPYTRFSALEKAIFGGIIGIVPTGIIGGLVGSASIRFPIYGNQRLYNRYRETMKRYSTSGN